ncbi:kinase-like protein [Serendipita vermifera]|nr:kinase-like protein [Serendipita vermifera]
MSSHALLLRLFLSPGFFSVLRALQYIRNYSDNIGITHYLTRRLGQVPVDELADKWMLVCNLLVTRPSKSTALEVFVLRKAEESTLLALLTLYFFQASLNDLALKRNTESFAVCSRVLQAVTYIIFAEPSSQTDGRNRRLLPIIPRKKIKPHLGPALVGLGTVWASCPALPIVSEVIGDIAVEQGRYIDFKSVTSGPSAVEEATVPMQSTSEKENDTQTDDPWDGDSEDEIEESGEDEMGQDVEAYGRALIAARASVGKLGQSLLIEPPSPSLVRRNTVNLTENEKDASQRKRRTPTHRRTATSRPTVSTSSLDNAEFRIDTSSQPLFSNAYQSRLLRSHYLHSEVQFLQTLSAISDRLLVIPKPARVSALRAELTNLNHQLPAEICLPLWCSYPKTAGYDTDVQCHHRIVRIPSSESVVLNSAERAPYLLLVEILHGDIDFNPTTHSNKELLADLQKNGPSPMRELPFQSPQEQNKLIAQIHPDITGRPSIGAIIPPTPVSAEKASDDVEEEMDLVEQLYGADLSVHSVNIDLTDSIVLPLAPKNKALDIAAWSRKDSSASSTPRLSTSMPASPSTLPPRHQSSASVSSRRSSPGPPPPQTEDDSSQRQPLSLEEYSNRMEAAAVMLAQLSANLVREPVTNAFGEKPPPQESSGGVLSWIPGSGWITRSGSNSGDGSGAQQLRMRLQPAEAAAIRKRIMEEMMALEDERMVRMKESEAESWSSQQDRRKTAQDEGIVRRELDKLDPSAAVFQESFLAKKARIKAASPYGHLTNWDCISVIVKTGADLRQEQLAGQLIQEFSRIWKEESCACWLRYFRILITGSNSGLVETITDAVSIHSIKKAEYARRLVEGRFANVSLRDYFINTYGDPSSARFARAQKNFAVSLAGYSVVSYLLQIKDRHNGNLLLDRDGHVIHIDFGFILESSPGGNLGFEAAPFKLPLEYVELLGGLDAQPWKEFKQHFRHGFETARKHCDSIITIVELMQKVKDSTLPCFAAFGEQTAQRLRDRFQPTLTHSLVGDHVEKLITASIGSAWTRLYDSVCIWYHIALCTTDSFSSINTTHKEYFDQLNLSHIYHVFRALSSATSCNMLRIDTKGIYKAIIHNL